MSDRNKPCRCGSGIKTKKCCDSPQKHAEAQERIAELIALQRAENAAKADDPKRTMKMAQLAAILGAAGFH